MAQGTEKLNVFDHDTMRLHLAVENTDATEYEIIEELQVLLEIGTDPNVKNQKNKTVLETAINRKLKIVIDFLLAHQADVNLVSFETWMMEEQAEINMSLIRYRLNEIENKKRESESAQYIEWLITRGFDFDRKNQNGKSALLIAIEYSLHHILPVLFKHTRDINYIGKNNQTLLHLYLDRDNVCSWPCEEYALNSIAILLVRGLSSDTQDASGRTAIHVAIDRNKSSGVIKMLVRHSKDIDRKNENGETAFYRLIRKWSSLTIQNQEEYFKELVDFLLAKGANINEPDNAGLVPVFHSLKERQIRVADYLRRNGAKFDVKSASGKSFLHLLLDEEYKPFDSNLDLTLLDIIIACGCAVNTKDSTGLTALDYAVKLGKSEIVQRLLERGADVNNRNDRMETPVFEAVRRRHLEIVGLLARYGADLNLRSENDESVMEVFIKGTDCQKFTEEIQTLEWLNALVRRGCFWNARDAKGTAPLHVAAMCSNINIVKKLIEMGASVNSRNKDGETPLHFATRNPNMKPMLEMLLENEADVDAKDSKGQTALHKIALESREHTAPDGIRVLLEHGADANARDLMGRTPLACGRSRDLADWHRRRNAWLIIRNRDLVANGKLAAAMLDNCPIEDRATEPVVILTKESIHRMAANLKWDKTINESVGLFSDGMIDTRAFCNSHYQLSQKDIETVKNTFIAGPVSLYHFIHMNLSDQLSYLDNNELIHIVSYGSKDPALSRYVTIIRAAYRKAMAWKRLVGPAKEAWLKLTQIKLPHDCIERILRFLNSGDLMSMIDMQ